MAKYPDISHWHPVTNWTKIKATCPFLISKATEGTNYIDPTLDNFIKGCEQHHIPYWLYTFLKKGNELAQAQYMINTCKNKVGNYFVGYILDVESGNTADGVKAALDWLAAQGRKMMLYTMYAQYSTYKTVIRSRPDSCAWWEARYGNNHSIYSEKYPPHTGADLHQFTSRGSCPGIAGSCDLNRIVQKGESWYTTPAALSVQNEIYVVSVADVWNKEQAVAAQRDIPAQIDSKIHHVLIGGVEMWVTSIADVFTEMEAVTALQNVQSIYLGIQANIHKVQILG